MSFWINFGAIFCIIAAIAVIILGIWLPIHRRRINFAPVMQIYKGNFLIDQRFVPRYKKFRTSLENLKEGMVMKITYKTPIFQHPVNNLFRDWLCSLHKSGYPKLVGFNYPGTNSIYFTICDTKEEMPCVAIKFPAHFTHGQKITEDEYEKFKEKDWWVGKMSTDQNTLHTICTLEKTTLPSPNV
jgi:hypothetical protein